MHSFWFVLSFLLIKCCLRVEGQDLHLTILHTSDVTSSYQQFDSAGDDCSVEEDIEGRCFGGVPRLGTIISQVRNERDDINVLLLDAGNQFGGEWFDFFQADATSYFMNRLGYDVMTLGNLEFAGGLDVLASFLQNINFDVVTANLNTTLEPALQGLFNGSVVKIIDGQPVGIVGYGVDNDIAQVAGAYFEDVRDAVQAEVEALTSGGINKIIVLANSFGNLEDAEVLEIAQNISGVDIIVLGGVNLYQYEGCLPSEDDIPDGFSLDKYPIVVTPNDDPKGKVLIVNGFPNAKSVGRLNVIFRENGKVNEWYGGPIRLDKEVEQDPVLLAELASYAEEIENVTNRLLGTTDVDLQGQSTCGQEECNLGNLIADAMVWKGVSSLGENESDYSVLAVMNGEGIKASIEQGEIRLNDIKEVLADGNTFDIAELEGRYIRDMLENAASTPGHFLQVSGMKVTYDLSKKNSRVVEVLVMKYVECRHSYLEPLEDDQVYKLVLPSTVGNRMNLSDSSRSYVTGELGENILAEYVARFSPIYRIIEGRIILIESPRPLPPIVPSSPPPPPPLPPPPPPPTPFPSLSTPRPTVPMVTTTPFVVPTSFSPTVTVQATTRAQGGGGSADKPRKQRQ